MKKWNDFLSEDPPAGHADRVMQAAQSELEKLALESNRSFWSQFLSWENLAAAGAFSVAGLALWFTLRKPSISGEGDLLAFQESFSFESKTDFEILASESADLDLLESLDILEEMEEV